MEHRIKLKDIQNYPDKNFLWKWNYRQTHNMLSGNFYCNICGYHRTLLELYSYYYYVAGDKIDNYKFEGARQEVVRICTKCATINEKFLLPLPDITKAAQLMEGLINKKPKKEEIKMSVIDVLNNEKTRLEKQLGELINVKLPENMPTHILEHLKMKQSLINNCIKSIDDLKNNYQLDETIKKIFTT
jgi:hypothetical protein